MLAWHRVEDEARADLRDALAPLGDHDELDDGEDEEDDGPDDVVAADHERSKRLDDLARVGLQQDEARGGYAERETVERREQEQCREGRDAERLGLVEDDEQDRDGGGQVGGDEDVEQPRGERHDHHPDDEDDECRQADVGARQAGTTTDGEPSLGNAVHVLQTV